MTLEPQIEAGRKLVARLEKYTYTELSDIPPEERMASAEVFGWFKATHSLIVDAFGDPSKQLERWDELQTEMGKIEMDEVSRHTYKEANAAIRRIHPSMGLLTEFQLYLNAHPKDQALAKQIIRHNPWISGSFYLFAFLSILVALRIVFGQLSPWLLAPTVFGSLLGVTVVGAFQLRNDDQLREKPFLQLMSLSLRSLPLIGHLMPHGASTNDTGT
jgi:hypothetical protein